MTQVPAPPTAPGGAPNPGKGLSIAGMVLGIVGLALFCFWYIGIPCAIVGLILSILGRKKSQAVGAPTGMATAGLVLSVIALALDIIIAILVLSIGLAFFGAGSEALKNIPRTTMLLLESFLA